MLSPAKVDGNPVLIIYIYIYKAFLLASKIFIVDLL